MQETNVKAAGDETRRRKRAHELQVTMLLRVGRSHCVLCARVVYHCLTTGIVLSTTIGHYVKRSEQSGRTKYSNSE